MSSALIAMRVVESINGFLTRFTGIMRPSADNPTKSLIKPDMMAPPNIIWPTPTDTQAFAISCPNCGSENPKQLLLKIDFTTSPGARKNTTVLKCPDCTCPFYADQIPPDYAENAMIERGRVPFYLQQGAGLSLITRPLAQIRAPKGSIYVEVGCGFGFGLDYAHHAKGWVGTGIDPAEISVLGQTMLGVSINRRYLGDEEPSLAATCDVVMASETIEHVLSPKAFVDVLRSMLRPNGILILTTPDGADLRPETAPGVLIGLLSPGLHLIFQTQESLHRLLINAGFRHIHIKKDGHSLVAFARSEPLDLESDDVTLRTAYRAYLKKRSHDFPLEHDLFMAFAGRAFQEAVNDAAFNEARDMRETLDYSCHARFGLSLNAIGKRTFAYSGKSVEDLAQCMPLSLGGLLYADAILQLASGTPRSSLAKSFTRAADAADLLRVALAELALADGMSEEIAWTARTEALLCLAASGTSDVVTELLALPPAPDAEHGAIRREVICERALVELVNAGHYTLAAELADATGLNAKAWADANVTTSRSTSQRDALFCLAVLDSQHDEPSLLQRSRMRFNRVCDIIKSSDRSSEYNDLFAAARRGETAALQQLGHHEEADTSSHRVDS